MSAWYQPLPDRQWDQDGFTVELQAHPLSSSKALLVIVIDDLWSEQTEPPEPVLAEALHALLRLNGDALLTSGWATLLDDDEALLLRAEVDLDALDGVDALEPWVLQGLRLAASVQALWVGLLSRTPSAPMMVQPA